MTGTTQNQTRHNGFAVRMARELRGLTVQELCDQVTRRTRDERGRTVDTSLSAPALRNIELEHKQPSVVMIQKIAMALDVDVRCLIRTPLTDWKTRNTSDAA